MDRHNACHIGLLAVLLLLLSMAPARGQSGWRSQQDQRGLIKPGGPTPTSEGRTALVIGNAAYTEGRLNNPVNDATAIAATLQEMSFQVTILRNAELQDDGRSCGCLQQKAPSGWGRAFLFCRSRLAGPRGELPGADCCAYRKGAGCEIQLQYPWGVSSAQWKMLAITSISLSWMPVAIIPTPAAFDQARSVSPKSKLAQVP